MQKNKKFMAFQRSVIESAAYMEAYEFPEFLRFLREVERAARTEVAEQTGLTLTRLMNLETGNFRWPPRRHEYDVLGKRYGIKAEALKNLYEKYAESRRAK